MTKKQMKRILSIVGISLLSLVVLVGIVIGALWHNEIASVVSIRMLVEANAENKSAPVYIMDVKGDYYFDDFIEEGGAATDDQLIQFIVDHITKGIIPGSRYRLFFLYRCGGGRDSLFRP